MVRDRLRFRSSDCTLAFPASSEPQPHALSGKLGPDPSILATTLVPAKRERTSCTEPASAARPHSNMKYSKHVVTSITSFSLAAVGLSIAVAWPSTPRHSASLDTIKALAGDWVAADQANDPDAPVQSSIRVTAGGSAVLETLFPGTEHEMLTIYHNDGEDLVLTHYCVLGNQPHYRACAGETEHQLVYECQGGTNIRTADDSHMHEGSLTIVDENHIRSSWTMFEKGEAAHGVEFDLVRVRKP